MGLLDRYRIDGQVAVVTGAGRGIGQGCALALAEVGADVVCGARTTEQIEATAAQVRARGRRALAVPCDVMERADLERLIGATLDEFGRIDIVINNAGGWPPRDALRTSEKAFEEAFRFNVTTAFLLTRLAVPKMVETAGGGSVVNISSRAGSMVLRGFAAYGTAKAALSWLTREMASEFAPKVRVNAIEVGSVLTSALDYVASNDEIKREMEAKTPMGRLGEVDDIALAALYLATSASSWVTGKVFQVDGGIEHPQFEVPTEPL
ncbi:MAG TPA: SDR family oxidoreductase [Acidimicrobiia bacterium]|nr:SDR family oxidoreductase [Acidimicrobiia bacterium]